MDIDLKKAFSIIAFSSVMLTLSICIGSYVYYQYKLEHCISAKAAVFSTISPVTEYYKMVHTAECVELIN